MSSKLFSLFQSLDKKEVAEMQKFIDSDFHNKHEKVRMLFSYLRKNYKNASFQPNKDKIFKYLYPSERYNDAKLRHVMSYLVNVIESYLSIKEFESDSLLKRIKLLRYYQKRKLTKHFDNAHLLLEKYDKKHAKRDLDYHLRKYQLSMLSYDREAIESRSENIDLQSIADNLDVFYVASKLKIACHIANMQNIFKKEHELRLFDEILDLIQEKGLFKVPIIGIYFNHYMTLIQPEQEIYFFQLKDQLLTYGDTFSEEELRDIYLLSINYCIKKLNSGNRHFLNEVFDLYKISLENGAILIDNKLSPYTYKNIASAGVLLKEYDWVDEFLEEYVGQLNTEDVESFYSFSKANLLFARKKFDEVTDLLLQAEIKDLFTQLDARVLQLKSYYELSEFDLMDSGVDNFRQLLGRRKILAYHKTNYSNFAKFLRRLSRTNTHSKEELEKFEQQLMETKVLNSKTLVY